jgi:drug/metabolite transporter (DMT)-like permease
LVGVSIIIGQPIIEKGFNGAMMGNLFFVLATIGAVGHVIYSKKIIEKYSAATITFWSFVIGALTFLPFFLYEMTQNNFVQPLDYRGYTGIIFGVFFSSLLAYFLFEWGTKRLAAQEVGIFAYIDPITAILIAVPLLGEVITPVFAIGSLLIFAGIYIAEGRLHYHPLHKLIEAPRAKSPRNLTV